MTTLPEGEENWVSGETASFSTDAVAGGSVPFPEPAQPWSDRAVLNSLIIAVGCLLGFYLTRAPRRRRERA